MRRRIGPVITSVLRIPRSASSIPTSRVTPLSDGEGLPPARTLQGVQHRADESSGARLPSLRGCLAALYGHRKQQGARTTDSTISWWVGDDAEGLAWIGLIRKRPEKAAKLGVHCDSTLRPRTYLILPRVQFQSGDPDWKHFGMLSKSRRGRQHFTNLVGIPNLRRTNKAFMLVTSRPRGKARDFLHHVLVMN